MKALEFKSKIRNNQIQIPKELQEELKDKVRDVKVILLYNDDEKLFSKLTVEQFLKGYSESDSIYDE